MKRTQEIATGLTLLLSVATVAGQQGAPPTDQKDPKQEQKNPPKNDAKDQKAPAEKSKDEPEKKPEPTYALPDLTLGWSQWRLSGNEHKFRQYATPPEGEFIRSFSYAPWTPDFRHDGSITILTPFQDDHRLLGDIRINHGQTILEASQSDNRFFDPTPQVIDASRRQVAEGYIRHLLTPDFAISLRSQMDQQDIVTAPPLNDLHQRTRTWTAAAQGSVGKTGFLDLSYTDWRYWDRTQVLPDTSMRSWSASYSNQFLPGLTLEGNFSRSLIDQSPLLGSRVDAWSFGGQYELTDNTALIFDLRRELFKLPTVESAYDKTRGLGRVRLVQHWQGFTGQLSYSRLDIERLREDHLFIDTPKWHTFAAEVSGKVSPSVRFSLRGSRQTMQGAAEMQTSDPRALYWRNRNSLQLKLDASSEFTNSYFVFGFHDDFNDARDARVWNKSITVGGSWQTSPDLELYAEGSTDMWGARTGEQLDPNLADMFPNASSLTIGANWTISPASFATASFTQVLTQNRNPLLLGDGNVSSRQFTGSYHYRLPSGYEFGLTVAPWQYTDRVITESGYDTAFISLTMRMKF